MEKSRQEIENERLLSTINPIAVEITKSYMSEVVRFAKDFDTAEYTKLFMTICLNVNETLSNKNWFELQSNKKL